MAGSLADPGAPARQRGVADVPDRLDARDAVAPACHENTGERWRHRALHRDRLERRPVGCPVPGPGP